MELIEVILSKENLNRAYKKVVANKGASGVDGVTVEELGDYIRENREKIVTSLRNRTYIPKPVRRVYIPKDNGKKRPLGIPTALDRTIQQAIAQPMCPWENGKIVRHCTTGRIYKVYQAWCRENNHGYARTAKEFREQLAGYLGGTFADVTTRQKGNTSMWST